MEKLKTFLIDLLFAVFFIAAGYFLSRQFNLNKETIIEARTVEFAVKIPADTIPKYVPVYIQKQSKDSSKFWRSKYDSLSSVIAKSDSSESGDSTFAEYFYPYQTEVEDSLTKNFLTIFPLNPLGTRVRIDSTRYDTLKFSFTYLDTTINVTRGNSLQTYGLVAIGAAAGSAAKNEIGAALGAVAALLIDWMFF